MYLRRVLMPSRPRVSIRALSFVVAGLSGLVLLLDFSLLGTLLASWVVSFGLAAALRYFVPETQRTIALALVAAGFAVRVATMLGIYYSSLALGKEGFLGADDTVYARAASMLVDYIRGEPASPANVPPYWAGHAYLIGPYVYLEALVFFLFGPVPLPVVVLNAGAMCAVALMASNIALRVFDARAGLTTAAVILFTPSLVVWSTLNMKDSITLFLVTALLWALSGFQQRPRWWMLAVPFLIAVPIEGLRRWAFYLLLVIIPIAVLVTPRLRPVSRAARWAGAAALVSALLLSMLGGSLPINQINAGVLENIRLAMAKGARTGYAYLPPEGVLARSGDTFVIVAPASSPTPTGAPGASLAVTTTPSPVPEPTPTPRTIIVAPGTRIVLATPTPAPTIAGPSVTPTPSPRPTPAPPGGPSEPPTVIVRPGDVIIVSTSVVAPVITQAPQPLVLSPDPETDQLTATLSGTDAVGRLVAYLPTGIVYALLAPFPWQLGRLADAATIPDMLLWYVLLGAAAISLWRSRARWRDLTAITLFAVATLAVFAVAEGNAGTLFRHRAMTIPFAIVLASPVLASIGGRLGQGLSSKAKLEAPSRERSLATTRGAPQGREPTLPG